MVWSGLRASVKYDQEDVTKPKPHDAFVDAVNITVCGMFSFSSMDRKHVAEFYVFSFGKGIVSG